MYGGEGSGNLLTGHHRDQIILKYAPRLTQYLHKFRSFHLNTSIPRNSKFDISSEIVSSSGPVSVSAHQPEHNFKVPFPPQSGAKLSSQVKYQQLFADNDIADKFVISEDKETDCQAQEDHLQHTGEVQENLGKT